MKKLNKEMFDSVLEYTENSPSGLIWKIDILSGKNKKQVSKGDFAGSIKSLENYWCIGLEGKLYQAHRIVAVLNGLDVTDKIVDHLDGNGLNNKISNIRIIDKKFNARNQKKYSTNSSGVCGVHIDKSKNSFTAAVNFHFNKRKVKSFSINKYGYEEAFRLACEWRENMIAQLNEQGAGYSERHGT